MSSVHGAYRPRIGIVGAGRSRNGLGPFLASAFEAASCTVTAVSGRTADSAAAAAAALAGRLGHAVESFGSAAALARSGGLDALVVAAPPAAHLEGLEAALAAGLPCLCEKPLVPLAQTDRGLEVVAGFAARDLLLMENCQWPFVLPTFGALYPRLDAALPASVALGLGPRDRGRAMIRDSLSHVLSVVQGLHADLGEGAIEDVTQQDAGEQAEANVVRFAVRCRGGHRTAVALHLRRCPDQPRPAWLAVDGRRADRRIGADYAWSLVAEDGRERSMTDPLHALVYRFALLLTRPCRDDTGTLTASIRTRLHWYRCVLAALDR